MSVFNGKRLTNETFKLDAERMRQGWYSDQYFVNVEQMLTVLAARGYRYAGQYVRLADEQVKASLSNLDVGNMEVEMQIFTRREGKTLVAGVDKALTMLRYCCGYWDDGGQFVETYRNLEVEALHDGDVVTYPPSSAPGDGDPRHVLPVMKIRGRYRDFALLETPVLGVLSRGSRIATNVYRTLMAARGKPVLFFPARFDAHEVQAADGYAYDMAVQRFNHDFSRQTPSIVSTNAQGDWWGGQGGGTVPHAVIACFLGDTAEAMVSFASVLPVRVQRIALVDFNNDSVMDSLRTLEAMFERYRVCVEADQEAEARRYILAGVRLDTSGAMRDVNVSPTGNLKLDMGVNPRLVFIVRQALDTAWQAWDLPETWRARAQAYCQNVKIAVSGGFTPKKIRLFEKLEVPADFYGVGSSLMSNDSTVGTNTDFTADVVRLKIAGEWMEMPKIGRRACDNPRLEKVEW
ncbi:MAG: nicotinate phosphoribosyltransferase [Anaerolineae bacterium]|nr:nicotinate phosphoribosyltransferase [Anaerolineae bacterium]